VAKRFESSEPSFEPSGGAAEHTISWQEILASMEAADGSDLEAQRIKTSVQALQDLAGRIRQQWLRTNASPWGVQRLVREEGKYINQKADQLEQEICAKIHSAWTKWLSQSTPQAAAEGGGSSSSAGAASSTLLVSGVAEHAGRRAAAGTKRVAGGVAGARSDIGASKNKKQCCESRGEGVEAQLFSAEDIRAKAALQWLQNQSGQATADVLLSQIAAWDVLLAGDHVRSRSIALAKSYGI
jgi:hypothetical protein